MQKRPSSNDSFIQRRTSANYDDSEDENIEMQQFRTSASLRSPPPRRFRPTIDEPQETTSHTNEAEIGNEGQEAQSSSIIQPITTQLRTRRPRITAEQQRELHEIFMNEENPTVDRRRELATRMNLSFSQVSSWFVRRRDSHERSMREMFWDYGVSDDEFDRNTRRLLDTVSNQLISPNASIEASSEDEDSLRRSTRVRFGFDTIFDSDDSNSNRSPQRSPHSFDSIDHSMADSHRTQQINLAVAIPANILNSFGPEGPKDDDDQPITDIEEMLFQKLLRKKMICDICFTNVKQFRCTECFYSMCQNCTLNITNDHSNKIPCPHCRTPHKQFLSIVLPRL